MKFGDFTQRLVHNWPVKVLSLVAAVMLYLLAQTAGLEQRELTVGIEVITASGIEAVPSSELEAAVRIRGPRDQVFFIESEDIILEADVSHIDSAGTVEAYVRLREQRQLSLIRPLEIRYRPTSIEVELREAERSGP